MPRSEPQNLSSRLQNLSINSDKRPQPSTAPKKPLTSAPPARPPVADSWEEEEDEDEEEDDEDDETSSDDTETDADSRPTLAVPSSPIQLTDYPSAPPPTPVSRPQTSAFASSPPTRNSISTSTTTARSPSHPSFPVHDFPTYARTFDDLPRHSSASSRADGQRPEKTTATASRMIAGALGVRAPKRTEEERQYDRAARDNERKRREREREERREEEVRRERARRAVWEEG